MYLQFLLIFFSIVKKIKIPAILDIIYEFKVSELLILFLNNFFGVVKFKRRPVFRLAHMIDWVMKD